MTEEELKTLKMIDFKVRQAKEYCSIIAEYANRNGVKVKPMHENLVLNIGDADFLLGLIERKTS
jgi:hypothetical protein